MTNKTIYNFKNIILSKKNKLKRSIFINAEVLPLKYFPVEILFSPVNICPEISFPSKLFVVGE